MISFAPCPICNSFPTSAHYRNGCYVQCTGPVAADYSLETCLICGEPTKLHNVQDGWVKSCVGSRHFCGITSDNRHVISLHRGENMEELILAWNKRFAVKEVA